MHTPSKDSIKSSEKQFRVVRSESFNGGTSSKINWQVCEEISGQWKLIRECTTKRDAVHFMYIMAKV